MEDGSLVVEWVCCVVDCGIVVNFDVVSNMVEGVIIDGIGNVFYGVMMFKDGVLEKINFDKYCMIWMREVFCKIDVYFV